jgi:hypothetical protein
MLRWDVKHVIQLRQDGLSSGEDKEQQPITCCSDEYAVKIEDPGFQETQGDDFALQEIRDDHSKHAEADAQEGTPEEIEEAFGQHWRVVVPTE